MRVRVYVYVARTHVHASEYTEARGRCWLFCSISLHLVPLDTEPGVGSQ